MRDALSLTDQCISFYLGQALTYERVLDMLGAVDTVIFSELLRLIVRADVAAVLMKLNALLEEGRDILQLVSDLIRYLRNLLLLKSSDAMEEMLFLGLRMADGVAKDDFRRCFGEDLSGIYGDVIRKHIEEGLLLDDGDRISLTERGMDLANYVLSDFIIDED